MKAEHIAHVLYFDSDGSLVNDHPVCLEQKTTVENMLTFSFALLILLIARLALAHELLISVRSVY